MLVIGMALLALAVVVGPIAYIVISRLQVTAALGGVPHLGTAGSPGQV